MLLKSPEQEVTEIYFGEKTTAETFLDGCWNSAYRYKKKLGNLPYHPVLKIISCENNKI